MDLREPGLERADLRALVALDSQGHFTRAAAALGISQPALTKRIRQLEERLGGPLFERHARGANATAAGRLLCERARALLEETTGAEHAARRLLAGDSGFLRVGAGLSMFLSGLPDVFHAFRRRHPDVHLSVRDMSTSDQLAALRAGEIDVGFVRMGERCPDLRMEPVMRDELRIACQPDLARRRNPDVRSLLEHPLVIVSRAVSPTFHDHVLATCRAAGCTPRVVQEADQLLTVLTLVQSGVGVSLVPASTRTLRLPRVRILSLALPGAGWTIGIAWRRESAGSAVDNFVRIARASLQG